MNKWVDFMNILCCEKSELYYKGYFGTVEYSEEDNCYYGKIENVNDTVLYEGNTVEELKLDFENAVNDYINIKNTILNKKRFDIKKG